MKTIFVISLVLTVFGAINSVLYGMAGKDLVASALGDERNIGSDFLRILIGLSAIVTLVYGLKLKFPGRS